TVRGGSHRVILRVTGDYENHWCFWSVTGDSVLAVTRGIFCITVIVLLASVVAKG
ncbi:hypothetical protein FOXB_01654, partial [Fusarium oxysporum f. sp. conglutinans Fo5176]